MGILKPLVVTIILGVFVTWLFKNLPAEAWLISGLLILGFAVYHFVSILLGDQDDRKALSWASDSEPEKSSSPFLEFSRLLVHKFALHWATKVKSKTYRKSVSRKISTAGLDRVLNEDEFIGLQILWGLLVPLFLLLLHFTLEFDFPPFLLIIFGLLGAWFPHAHVRNEKKKRYIEVIVDLPFFIDLLALSTEAGLDFIGAIQRVVEKSPAESVLGTELGLVLRDLKLGQSRAEALRGMATRLDISEITSFVAVLIDADATGASIGHVLKQRSIQMRVERFARAEKAGAQASQAVLIPLMVFILPAVMIMVFGPMVIQFLGLGIN